MWLVNRIQHENYLSLKIIQLYGASRGEASSRLFYKKLELSMSLDQQPGLF